MTKSRLLKGLDASIAILQKVREEVVSERDTRRLDYYDILLKVSNPCSTWLWNPKVVISKG